MQMRLLRHATVVLTYAGRRLMVDPVFSPAGTTAPIPTWKRSAGWGRRNPLVGLPVSAAELQEILGSLDGVLVTHMHGDHFDQRAGEILPKNLSLLCQAEDAPRLEKLGFSRLYPITDRTTWEGIGLARVGGSHGGPLTRRKLGIVSGFVLEAAGEPSLYIAGDTVRCRAVREALRGRRPEVIVVNAGAAQLPLGRSITMNDADIAWVCRLAPAAKVVAVHMEAINHCLLTRAELGERLARKGLAERVSIPADGEVLVL